LECEWECERTVEEAEEGVSDKDPFPPPLPLALPQVLLLPLLSSSDEQAVTGDSLEDEIMLWLLDGGLRPDCGGCCGCDCDCCDCRCSKHCW
jgi:hypothetical protein